MFAEKQGESGRKMVKLRQDFTQKSMACGSGGLGWHEVVLAAEAGLGEGQRAALCLLDVALSAFPMWAPGRDRIQEGAQM